MIIGIILDSIPTICYYIIMLGIIVALNSELESLFKEIKVIKEETVSSKRIITGKIKNVDVVIAITNCGKVAASQTTQLLIDKYSPDLILNYGSCGGVSNSVKATEIFAVKSCCQYDFDLSELDKCAPCFNQNYNSIMLQPEIDKLSFLKTANLATSDRFTYKAEDVEFVRSLGCELCDMEGCAIAQVCDANKVPYYVIKGVTDVYGSGVQSDQFLINMKTVKENLKNAVLNFVGNL